MPHSKTPFDPARVRLLSVGHGVHAMHPGSPAPRFPLPIAFLMRDPPRSPSTTAH